MHSISTSHRVATAVFFATAMCSFATQAQAGGLFVPLGGVATSGRAGAAVVSTRDPNAIAYNPALIALNEGHQILVDATWAMLNLEYQRSPQVEPNGTTTTFQKVKNEAVGIVIPQILFTTDFGTDQFGLGVGLFPPNLPNSPPWGRNATPLSTCQIRLLSRRKSLLHGVHILAFPSARAFKM